MLNKLQEFLNFWKQFTYLTIAKFQYNMMARVDDTTELKMENLRVNPQFPFALLCQLCWSKNLQEERAMPFQILLGSADHCYCILLALGLYLVLWIASSKGLHSLHVFVAQNETPAQVNEACYSAIKTYAFNAEDFDRADDPQPDWHSQFAQAASNLSMMQQLYTRGDRGTWPMTLAKQICEHAIC